MAADIPQSELNEPKLINEGAVLQLINHCFQEFMAKQEGGSTVKVTKFPIITTTAVLEGDDLTYMGSDNCEYIDVSFIPSDVDPEYTPGFNNTRYTIQILKFAASNLDYETWTSLIDSFMVKLMWQRFFDTGGDGGDTATMSWIFKYVAIFRDTENNDKLTFKQLPITKYRISCADGTDNLSGGEMKIAGSGTAWEMTHFDISGIKVFSR